MSGDRVEGRVKFKVGDAFYRPASALSRDLGVLAAALHRGDTGGLRVLDAMAGCGARSLRYWVESGADWVCANDANPDLNPILPKILGLKPRPSRTAFQIHARLMKTKLLF